MGGWNRRRNSRERNTVQQRVIGLGEERGGI